MGDRSPTRRALRILYVAVVAAVTAGGLLAMVDWGRRALAAWLASELEDVTSEALDQQ